MGQLGTLLTRAREARGLTLEDAERDTRISKRYLQALEDEEFEVIPAPVYARGFLRSYSQYLGIDPQETMLLFPRDEDELAQAGARKPTMQDPVSAVGPARPAWRRPPGGRQSAATPPGHEMAYEPTIGVDIGVPARRIKTDPAAQTRTLTVAVIAIGVIVGVLVLAFLISALGGDDPAGGPTDFSTPENGGTAEPTATPTTPSGSLSGVVPSVVGMDVSLATATLQSAGYTVNELREASTQPADTVIDQSPAANSSLTPGQSVTIVVSTGSG